MFIEDEMPLRVQILKGLALNSKQITVNINGYKYHDPTKGDSKRNNLFASLFYIATNKKEKQ